MEVSIKRVMMIFVISMALVSSAAMAAGVSLHDAVRSGNLDEVKKLIAEESDVNVKDKRGNTPLHVAVGLAKKEIIEMLLAKGADVNIKNTAGKLPVDIAKISIKNIRTLGKQIVFAGSKEEYQAVIKLLKDHKVSP